MHKATGLLVKGASLAIGVGISWFAATLIMNENQLLHRRLELEKALIEKSKKKRQKLLLGN